MVMTCLNFAVTKDRGGNQKCLKLKTKQKDAE